ncbi:MAG: NAD(+)/NADH kinase [Bdellovibrionales bacterium]|nr:NAD(+)/NADH kinase [Bdellovibrionales bacterium]
MKKIWIRSKSSHAQSAHKTLADAFAKAGFEVCDEPSAKLDLAISVGGDGTFLATLRELGAERFRVPVLGVHASRGRGFLLPIALPKENERKKWAAALASQIKKKQFGFEERWGLTGVIHSAKGRVLADNLWALNDLVVSRSTLSRLVWLRVSVDDRELFARLRGDGFIVSSASGSTAYALSAGGPVMHPSMKNLLLTPICSQSLAHRSVVLGEDSRVTIEVLDNDTPSNVTSDGQAGQEIASGSWVHVARAPKPVKFLIPEGLAPMNESFFHLLRVKLGFGGE